MTTTTAPTHATILGKRCVATFGNRLVRGTIDDTTVTAAGVVCVSLLVDLVSDEDCDGVWTSQFEVIEKQPRTAWKAGDGILTDDGILNPE